MHIMFFTVGFWCLHPVSPRDGCVEQEGDFSESGTGDSVDSTTSIGFAGAELHNCEGGASREDLIALRIPPITKPLGLWTTFCALGDITCN